ncbi:unnamed protein product [Nezara viridula]|uniref:Ig-like domain-containing protein n=1 Tax=Nezara viridula TaxID=85310 RepID=A0A9P0E2D7_NEZVI|nr:unnamed protein product [Nezara viridula]
MWRMCRRMLSPSCLPISLVHVFTGEVLELTNVHRSDMGSYLCIASNGIPPSVSKRYIVQINFHPKVVVSNQLVAAPIGSDVLLHCYVESWPKAMHSWTRENGIKLMNIPKYHMEEYHINEYSLNMNLTIKDLEKHDFGGYNCSSVNALGKAESTVRLTELHIPTKTTLIPVTHDTGRRKVVIKQKTQPPPTKKPRKKMRIEEVTTPPPAPQIPTRSDWFDQQNEIDGSGYWHRAHFLQIILALLVISAIC